MILETKKLALIESVQEQFDVDRSLEDLAILYEITGFQAQIHDDLNGDFWANYANFKDSSKREFDDLLEGINNKKVKVSLNTSRDDTGD